MASSSRIPAFPIPEEPAELRALLIEQILTFQARYDFAGEQHTKETLAKKSDGYLEKLCSMQLLGIATSSVRDTLINK